MPEKDVQVDVPQELKEVGTSLLLVVIASLVAISTSLKVRDFLTRVQATEASFYILRAFSIVTAL